MTRSIMLALVPSAISVAAPAAAEVFEQRADAFIIRDTVTVKTDATETWLALTKPGEWWDAAHTWSGDPANMTLIPQGGECFCERIPGSDSASGSQLSGSVAHGMVIQASPLKMLRLSGALGPLQSEPVTGILTFALKEVDGGTQIQMEYNVGGPMRFDVAKMAPVVDKVLVQQLARLRDHLGAADAAPPAADVPPGEE